MAKDIKLKRFEVSSFGGINPNNPVLIDFSARKNSNKNITRFVGDQGTGKTSTITALMFALGATFKVDVDNFINSESGTIKDELEFEVDGVQYKVNATKSRFLLEMYSTDLKRWMKVDEPKTTMQKLVGHLGTSPMPLKEKDGAKQIDWFRDTFGNEEVKGKEKKVLKGIEECKTTRREANREYTKLKNALALNELYQDYENNSKRFTLAPSVDKARDKMNEKKAAAEQYNRGVEKVANIINSITTQHNEIDRIKQMLIAAENKLEELKQQKAAGEKFIADNAMAVTEYEEAEQEFVGISKTLTEYKAWQDVVVQKKEMDEYETIVQNADSKKDELMADLRKLTKKYLPEIEGLEIKINTGIDDEEAEGIIYKEKTLAQLSESELWALYMQICEAKDVNFIFIENVSSLGNNAVETLNMLAENGVRIFASEMDRKKESMKILITDKID